MRLTLRMKSNGGEKFSPTVYGPKFKAPHMSMRGVQKLIRLMQASLDMDEKINMQLEDDGDFSFLVPDSFDCLVKAELKCQGKLLTTEEVL